MTGKVAEAGEGGGGISQGISEISPRRGLVNCSVDSGWEICRGREGGSTAEVTLT